MIKKTALLTLLSLVLVASKAQTSTDIEIRHPDGKPPGVILVFKNHDSLGKTDFRGYFSSKTQVYAHEIRLFQNGKELSWEVTDTTYTTTLEGGKIYVLTLAPPMIEQIIITGTRSGKKEPVSQSTISRAEIQSQNTGRDLPVILQFQPGVTVTSDAGAGIGYTGIRVRGSDATRTNVTLNGVPVNDAESHGTWWVNMPDLASGLSSVQIQRGAGTSSNGAGAFGASVNMQTFSSQNPYSSFETGYGSFNTSRFSVSAGTGLINGHWNTDIRLSAIRSDGFVDRAESRLQSYMFSTGYTDRKWSLKILSFGGREKTYQAWWGVPIEKFNNNAQDLFNHYQRNLGVTYKTAGDSINLFNSDPSKYNYYTYQNETDNYSQNHYHLYFTSVINKYSRLNATLYYTRGLGYYEQFRFNDKLSNYNKLPAIIGTDTIYRTDLIRQRWLDNHLAGLNLAWQYEKGPMNLIIGGGYNQYSGDHYGKLIWARLMPAAEHNDRYYFADGFKTDGNLHAKLNYQLNSNLSIWVDLQGRHVYHKSTGFDNDQRDVSFTADFLFFNPKAGVFWQKKQSQWFASVSRANREPSRTDFSDNPSGIRPKPETLTDFEAGYKTLYKGVDIFLNGYYMHYKNQLVITGAVNDVGNAIKQNVPNSYRMGIEAGAEKKINAKLRIGFNMSLSQNRIRAVTNVIPDYFTYQQADTVFSNVPIAMSPSVNSAAWISYLLPWNIEVRWMHKYISRQYLDNTGDKYRSLDPFYVSEMWFNKEVKLKKGGSFGIQFQILNLFNAKYAANGYTFMYTYGSRDITQEVFVYPQAGRNLLGKVYLKF